jgi:hypothetical protein
MSTLRQISMYTVAVNKYREPPPLKVRKSRRGRSIKKKRYAKRKPCLEAPKSLKSNLIPGTSSLPPTLKPRQKLDAQFLCAPLYPYYYTVQYCNSKAQKVTI